MGRISFKGMLGLVLSAICFAVSIFFPWWALRLTAPQYKEGLYMWVYPYKMEGNLDIINSLNHYIGMKQFSEATFPELSYLSYIVGGVAILTLVIAISRNRTLLAGWTVIILALGIVGIYDIYRWLHTFGANLSSSAPIEVDPFTPPIFGTNQLANFETFSFFSYGAGFAGIAIFLLLVVLWKGKERHV
ncbi:hypothetical protein GCM10011409_31990 [Lentibacillus populi]|uniref:Uncharacterized protein n=1 Tax=Lentibacillus populi TaxID=1827502 RepID=A0A9W5TZM0_9BACI|nr:MULTISPECIES: hypothetical protein [Bacillaceae]MBT2216514.1 hypothetical protein [Virgibacillus dakarensis]GGB51987.1 hypothetical protein GCM10011409_31990 [Lentibacillus populi]